jgi:hypothetical protein
MVTATCPQCGTRFTPNHGNQVYCSERCRLIAKGKRPRDWRPVRPDSMKSFTIRLPEAHIKAINRFKLTPKVREAIAVLAATHGTKKDARRKG